MTETYLAMALVQVALVCVLLWNVNKMRKARLRQAEAAEKFRQKLLESIEATKALQAKMQEYRRG